MRHSTVASLRLFAKAVLLPLCAATLFCASAGARAGLLFQASSIATRSELFDVANLPNFAVGTTLQLGTLAIDAPGTITFTYFGYESGFSNSMAFTEGTMQGLNAGTAIGTSISAFVNNPGAIAFMFEDGAGNQAINGGNWYADTSIGLIGENVTLNQGDAAGTYAFVLGFNDSGGSLTLGDWDDFVVGVNFTPYSEPEFPLTPNAIPEPASCLMLMLGLGMMGCFARRRQRAVAA